MEELSAVPPPDLKTTLIAPSVSTSSSVNDKHPELAWDNKNARWLKRSAVETKVAIYEDRVRGWFLDCAARLQTEAGSPFIRPVTGAGLRERLAAAARWMRIDKKEAELRPCFPPVEVVAAIEARGEWRGVRPLVGLCESPVLRADGSVLQTPGYDLATGYLYEPSASFPIVPDRPALDDARRACDALLEIVCDFPFASDTHRAAWLAALLTPFARPAIEGCTPFIAIDASVRGSGKSLLSETIALLATGRESSRTPQAQNDEEMRKRITSLLREGESLVVLDNISRPIDYPSLDAAVTTTRWRDRILGTNETISAPNQLVWTGNNLVFGGDIVGERSISGWRARSRIRSAGRPSGIRHSCRGSAWNGLGSSSPL